MAAQENDRRRHLVLTETSEPRPFTAHSTPRDKAKALPQLDRARHGASLQNQVALLKPVADKAASGQKEQGLVSGLGLQIQFVSQPEVELAFESLHNEKQKIELLSLRREGEHTVANVFVPDGKLEHFERYIAEYLEEKKDVRGNPRDHRALLNTIAAIRAAEIRFLWTDDPELLPEDRNQMFWWEVWLPVRGRRDEVVADFRRLAALAECRVSDSQVHFPERTVVLMYGSEQKLSRSVHLLNCIAELRRAKETADFFHGLAREEQQAWMDEMLARLNLARGDEATPRICLLDTGVTHGHPLLRPLMDDADLHTVNPAWGVDDAANHGTGMAGLAAYGDLTEALASAHPVQVGHRLESVKLLPDEGANVGDARHHAYLFAEGVSRPEISAPNRRRLFTSAVTASDYRDRGRPSSWSSTVDRLAADYDGAGASPRLFVLSAGNSDGPAAWSAYHASLSTNLIHDPGQAWNALTVGAFTEKAVITEADAQHYQPIATSGGLSPHTTTSATWEPAWPLKPDIVMEGGNIGEDALGPSEISSLDLLTTHHRPLERLFWTTYATSAASAQCARMAAQLMEAYPLLRPETIRALIAHSAEWTPAMRQMYLSTNPTKRDYVNLIRHCGWGVPNLDQAMWSAGNSLTLVVEDLVHPYKKEDGEPVKTRDMNLHALPWPKQELEDLQEVNVKMRVTLSYFVEPNPSARGTTSKYHYPSHRLRFDVQRPLDESTDDFVARINAAAAAAEEGEAGDPKDPNWYLGENLRHRGSLHQDIWEGTAADLASRGFIAVYPALGWWRTRPALERYGLPARYSLIVSIHTEQTEVDLYAAIAQKIGTEVEVRT